LKTCDVWEYDGAPVPYLLLKCRHFKR